LHFKNKIQTIIASEMGLSHGVEALLETESGKACALKKDEHGRLPIHLAAAAKREDIVTLLLPVSYAEGEKVPTLDELMHHGSKVAEEHDQRAAAEAELEADKKSLASLIENTKPAANAEDAEKSRQAKDEGNAFFVAKDFENALVKYSEAIHLDGSDATYFANRSACWLELAKMKKDTAASVHEVSELQRALADAEQCRRMKPDWVKGCYRLAAARLANGLYEDAAVAAYEGLRLDDQNNSLKKLLKESVAKGREAHFKDQK
jgi:tetratricopeptide (TPR) repeat protein